MNTWHGFIRCMAASAASIALVVPLPASALDWFLKIDGIKGESTAKGHENEILIDSFSWGVRSMASVGTMRGTRACVSEMAFAKLVDSATPLLLANAASGMSIPKAVLVGRKSGEAPLDFLKIELTNVLISSVSHSGSAEVVQEAFELRFMKARVVYTPQGPDGKPGTPIETTISASTCQ
jgi:type VI secretion system secreted protein Hcp